MMKTSQTAFDYGLVARFEIIALLIELNVFHDEFVGDAFCLSQIGGFSFVEDEGEDGRHYAGHEFGRLTVEDFQPFFFQYYLFHSECVFLCKDNVRNMVCHEKM